MPSDSLIPPPVVPLIEARGLGKSFGKPAGPMRRTPPLRAVQDVDLTIRPGETIGLVGESGSGKSTLARLILGLMPISEGALFYRGRPVAGLGRAERLDLRRRLQLVFQDPYSSLDPRRPVGAQIADGLAIHGIVHRRDLTARVRALMQEVGLDPALAGRLPGALSGGQRQRVCIARALATEPEFLVADEAVSALDVSVQAQIMALLADISARRGMALVFISHDLSVIRHTTRRIVVLYLGRIVETGPTDELLANPRHPYTQALVAAVPRLDSEGGIEALASLSGELPSPRNPPSGCVFRTRCPLARPECAASVPMLRRVAESDRRVACLFFDTAGKQPAQPLGNTPDPGPGRPLNQ